MGELRRIQVSETAPMAAALRKAHHAWPDEQHVSRLVERLAVIGARHIPASPREDRIARIRAALAPAATTFPDDYLDRVRDGWR